MSGIEGQWHDGRTSVARRVQLERVGPGVLRVTALDDGSRHDWPLGEVVPSPRLGNTPRLLRRAGHGQIECADDPVLASWFPRSPSRIEAAADWLERRRVAILVAAVGTVLFAIAFLQLGVPWIALQVAERMPRAVETQVSSQALALLERMYLRPSELPEDRRRALEQGFADLVQGQPRQAELRLHFTRSSALGANAFALPDGRIHITDALVELAGGDDEIMAVLAHEAGHHVHRHGMRQAIESSSVLLVVGLFFGDASGSSLAVSLPAVLLSSGYSRAHEREADAWALDLLAQRDIDPAAFSRIMQRLAAQAPATADQGPLGWLSTHPPTPERIEAAERAAHRAREGGE